MTTTFFTFCFLFGLIGTAAGSHIAERRYERDEFYTYQIVSPEGNVFQLEVCALRMMRIVPLSRILWALHRSRKPLDSLAHQGYAFEYLEPNRAKEQR